MERLKEQIDLRWLNLATAQINVILQKKLFDLQCLWRAEKVTLPGVDICYDFEEIGKNIMNCSFLEPITRDEINLYIQFLHSNEQSLNNGYVEWQNYEQIKESTVTDDNIPEWYDFHNTYTGKGTLLLLPDIRGEKKKNSIKQY